MITIELFQFILPLTLLLVTAAAFLVYLLLKVPSSYWIKWLGVPALLLVGFFSYNIYTEKLGQPIPTTLPENEFVLFGGRIIGKQAIELWILEDRRTPRLIRIPYDKKTAKELQIALERANKGIPQMGKGKSKGKSKGTGKGNKDRSDGGELGNEGIFYDYPHARERPKLDDRK